MKILSFLLSFILFATITNKIYSQTRYKDPRDGQVYKIVKIGNQIWFAENLNYKTTNSWCYNNSSSNCATYGRLYDWNSALIACPDGWHLPNENEWTILESYVDSKYEVSNNEWNKWGLRGYDCGDKLKSVKGWHSSGNGIDFYGFKVLPGGCREWNGSNFNSVKKIAFFWLSDKCWYRALGYNHNMIYRFKYDCNYGYSVRCLKN
ncbi:fibrobacter succinogenes major paralogous domain-containing protein [Candidatus Babeliales bacterium]|nr:fibrobacter succinogenes major paralogous domain-containing protein [Candidatus Babeliales bacterium]